MPHRIRPLALCLIRRGDSILVFEGHDSVKGETFYRLLGGEIEFGKSGAEAAKRELREELGVELDRVKFVCVLENRFVYEGQPGHEIALVYETVLRDRAFYDRDTWRGLEFDVMWKPLGDFRDGADRLYPEGLLETIEW